MSRTFALVSLTVFAACNPPPPSLSNNADLSALVMSAGSLSPAFDPESTSYASEVPFATDSIKVTATTADSKASLAINDTPSTSGAESPAISLAVGATTITIAVTAEDGVATRTYSVTITRAAPASDKAMTAFSFASPAENGTIDEGAKAIAVTVPFGTDVTALVATFTSTGKSVQVGSTQQVSGTTPNDFTQPVAYTVTAEDDSTATYTVTVTIAVNTAKAITSFGFTSPSATGVIDEGAKTIAVSVPYLTVVTALVANFTTTGVSVAVGSTEQVSGTTANDFSSPLTYVVTAANGSTASYVVTVTVLPPSSSKAISTFSIVTPPAAGSIDEGAKTIDVTVPYGTDVTSLVATFTVSTAASVAVGSTAQLSGTTPNDFTAPVIYTVTAQNGTTVDYTVTVTVASGEDKAITSFGFPSLSVTGMIDEVGKTINVTVPNGTDVTTLVATFTTTGVAVDVASTTQTSGVTPNDFTSPVTYTVTALDSSTVDYLVTVVIAPSSAKEITAFSFATPAAVGVVDENAKAIAVTVPFGTDVTALVASFTVSAGASVDVGVAPQVSGITDNDFTNPVTYTVTAEDSSTVDYLVTVTVAAASSDKAFSSFSFDSIPATGVIDEDAKTIDVSVPNGTDVSALVATFAVSAGASVDVGSTPQVSGTTDNDFTNPVTYTVTAEDASTVDYVVTVTIEP